MKLSVLTVVLLAAAAIVGFSQALTVDYLDGNVELKTAKGWKAVAIGDSVPPDASLRITQSGSLELSRGRQKISLVKDGVYAVAELTKSTEKSGSTGLGAAFGQKLKALTEDKGSTSTTVGGVRGAAQGEPEPLMWVDESDDSRKKISELLMDGQYGEAAPMARSALADATDEKEIRELSYLLATAYYGAGQTAKAYKTVSRIQPDSGDPYFYDFAILKAQILLATSQYGDGLAMTKKLLASRPKVAYAQAAYLLSAQCSRALGDEATAKAALKAGYDLDPSSDTAKLITGLQR
jgi:tetratricopeptide (TPR) repeat protein